MENPDNPSGRAIRCVEWTARLWSLASIGLLLAFVIGEGVHPTRAAEWLGILFFPLGITIGMILAWWREGTGGAVTVASLLAFYLVHRATSGTFPAGWAWIVIAAPGFLFLLGWAGARHRRSSHAHT